MFEIRNAEFEDLDEICRVYEAGRAYMRSHGNDVQWVGDDFPFRAKLENDIRLRQLYVVTNAGDICGVFAYIIGVDKTYLEIENGAWLSDDPYGTIHRIASDGRFKGVAKASFEWCYYNHDLDLRVEVFAEEFLVGNGKKVRLDHDDLRVRLYLDLVQDKTVVFLEFFVR